MKRLFAQKTVYVESASCIKQILDTTTACLKSLENLGIKVDTWDAIVNHLVLTKLDLETRRQWENHVSQQESDELPTWTLLKRFLETRFRTLEMLEGGKAALKPTAKQPYNNVSAKPPPMKKAFHSTAIEEKKQRSYNNEKGCAMCDGGHTIHQCKQFEKQSPEQRSELVQSKGLCFNCLSSNHSARYCRQPNSCRRCGRRHHQMLHYERVQNHESVSQDPTSYANEKSSERESEGFPRREPEKRVVAHFATESNECRVLLATALVRVKSCNGHSLIVRALIDQGSEVSFVSEATAQSLGLKKSFVNGTVSGIGEGQTKTKSLVCVELESLCNPDFSMTIKAFVLKKLTSFLPSNDSVITNWPMIASLSLADPTYGSPGKIDMILRAEVYGVIMSEGLLRHPSVRGPIAQNTQLGWILSGRIENDLSVDRHIVSLHVQLKEDQLLKQFWEIEREPDLIEKRMTKEELRCEEIFEETTKRDESGRYIVRLPFKIPNPECVEGKTKEIAKKRLQQLEKRLYKNPRLHEEYQKAMYDYLQQDHMELISDISEIEDDRVVYLPHHPVVREDKETTKVRIVYNASSKGENNVSLNDNLLVGPKLQPDLRHTLMRWRRHEVCIVADLKQMYRQVMVNKEDTDFQRILWRSKENEAIQHYRLLRLTFGTACAPYLAVKTLQQLAKDEETRYPIRWVRDSSAI